MLFFFFKIDFLIFQKKGARTGRQLRARLRIAAGAAAPQRGDYV